MRPLNSIVRRQENSPLHVLKQLRWIALVTYAAVVGPALATDHSDEASCPRGEPEAIFPIGTPNVLKQSFRPETKRTSIEQIELTSGESIRVRHWGCEYYVLTFVIEPRRSKELNMPADVAYPRAAAWLDRLTALKIETPFDLSKVARTLRQYHGMGRKPSFDLELPVEGDGTDFLQTRVRVEIPEPGHKPGAIQFSLFTGPL